MMPSSLPGMALRGDHFFGAVAGEKNQGEQRKGKGFTCFHGRKI